MATHKRADIEIDPKAPAGSENSLGAESVRDGRPGTDSEVVEAMDEVGTDVTVPGPKGKHEDKHDR